MSNKQAGKGDKPRPVNKQKYNENFDLIDWNKSNEKQQMASKKSY